MSTLPAERTLRLMLQTVLVTLLPRVKPRTVLLLQVDPEIKPVHTLLRFRTRLERKTPWSTVLIHKPELRSLEDSVRPWTLIVERPRTRLLLLRTDFSSSPRLTKS